MATEVKCTVSNCQFWARGNYCAASAILITHGKPRMKDTGEPAGKLGADSPRIESTPIKNIEDSYCYTFLSKGT